MEIIKDLPEVFEEFAEQRKNAFLGVKELKDKDYTIYGTKVDNGTSLKDIKVLPKYAIVMGNEGNGMSNIVSSLCDKFIYIDMNSKCESLNVSIATSIILYEFNK